MSIFSLLTVIGGLSFFLYGMNVLSTSLQTIAGGKLEILLKKMTSNKFKGFLFGVGITAIIQSSSAVTVMLVGLVNSNIMSIEQTVGIIIGTNVGKTLTSWLFTFVGIESNNVFMQLLKPENFSLIFAFIGILMIMISKNKKRKDIGSIFIGFAILMYGMFIMSSAVKPLANNPTFMRVLTIFHNPFLGVLVGLVVTAIIQSSAASVGMLQALASTGSITYGSAIPIIMGQNIGTCVTSLLSSFGVSKSAKKVSAIHIIFNVLGTIICLSSYLILNSIFKFSFVNDAIGIVGIAIIHSSFNIITTILLFPFSKQIVGLADKIIKSDEQDKYSLLDERLINVPTIALSECLSKTNEMAELAKETLLDSILILKKYDEKKAQKVYENEEMLDKYEDAIGSFLVKLSAVKLKPKDTLIISKILSSIGDYERIGDHALNIVESSKELNDNKIYFSKVAQKDLNVLYKSIEEILDISISVYRSNDEELANNVKPLAETIEQLIIDIKNRHYARLQKGKCSMKLGFILNDVLNDFERVSVHCLNIAVATIQNLNNSVHFHNYKDSIRIDTDSYKEYFDIYKKKYKL